MLPNGNLASAAKRGPASGAALQEKDSPVPSSTPPSKPSTNMTTTTTTRLSSSAPQDKQKDAHVHSHPQTQARPWLATPAPIKRLFAQFPLQTLRANSLPSSRHDDDAAQSTSHSRSRSREKTTPDQLPVLHIFSTPAAAAQGAPSFNPSCLQHQTWLRAHGIRARAVCSSNHAAPSGVLPFLVLGKEQRTVSGVKMWEWVAEQGESGNARTKTGKKDSTYSTLNRARETAYLSLIEHRLRAAWLLALYLTPANFSALCQPLYIDPTTSSLPVRTALASHLRTAARTALHALSPPTAAARQHQPPSVLPDVLVGEAFPSSQDAQRIYAAAADALHALSELLGKEDWFFGAERPGRLDVVLFSYIHLMADESLRDRWADRTLVELLRAKNVQNLVRHRERILSDVWGDGPTVVAPDEL